ASSSAATWNRSRTQELPNGAEARDGAHPAAQPHRRSLRAGHLRRLGRPDEAQAHPGRPQPPERGLPAPEHGGGGRGADRDDPRSVPGRGEARRQAPRPPAPPPPPGPPPPPN